MADVIVSDDGQTVAFVMTKQEATHLIVGFGSTSSGQVKAEFSAEPQLRDDLGGGEAGYKLFRSIDKCLDRNTGEWRDSNANTI